MTARFSLWKPSALVLVGANLVPLGGVLFFGWEAFPIMLLFWAENVMVGIFNVLKMLAATPRDAMAWVQKVFFVPFFTVHYGMFATVHGVLVFALFGAKTPDAQTTVDAATILRMIQSPHIGWAVLALAASHAYSFGANYIGLREYERTTVEQLMMEPYGRVIVLHTVVVVGGILMLALNTPRAGLVLLVLLKVILDLRAHLRQHARYATKSFSEPPLGTRDTPGA